MRFLIIVTADQREAANAAAVEHFDRSGAGALTFTVPLFPEAAETDDTPSHYWCSAEVTPANVPLLQALQAAFPGSALNEYDLAAQPGYPHERLVTMGLRTAAAPLAS